MVIHPSNSFFGVIITYLFPPNYSLSLTAIISVLYYLSIITLFPQSLHNLINYQTRGYLITVCISLSL